MEHKDEAPKQYIIAITDSDMGSDEMNITTAHSFDITREGNMYTASCEELHAITQAQTWVELKNKIEAMHDFIMRRNEVYE